MSEERFVYSPNHRACKEKRGKTLGEKAQKFVVKAAETWKSDLITASLSTVTSVWVSDACYKRYTHPRKVNKTVIVADECTEDQPNQPFERRRRSAPFGYWTHYLVCEGELNFDLAEKKPDVAKYQFLFFSFSNKLPFRKSKLGMQSLSYVRHSTWNKLSNNLKTATRVNCFKHEIKKYFLKKLGETEADIYYYA